jgi:hypothetical protein
MHYFLFTLTHTANIDEAPVDVVDAATDTQKVYAERDSVEFTLRLAGCESGSTYMRIDRFRDNLWDRVCKTEAREDSRRVEAKWVLKLPYRELVSDHPRCLPTPEALLDACQEDDVVASDYPLRVSVYLKQTLVADRYLGTAETTLPEIFTVHHIGTTRTLKLTLIDEKLRLTDPDAAAQKRIGTVLVENVNLTYGQDVTASDAYQADKQRRLKKVNQKNAASAI